MFETQDIQHILIFLAAAGVIVPLFGRFRVGIVPAFLIAGVILGPLGLGKLAADYPWLSMVTFSTDEHVLELADLGVLFLLFIIGLEFSLERLWAMRKLVLGLGSVQFLVSVAVIVSTVYAIGLGFDVALIIGLAMALSSTAIVTQVLIEARRFAAPVGQVSIGVLLFQDLMVVPVVIVVGLLGGESQVHGAILQAVALAVAALVIIVLAGRYLVGPLLKLAARTGSREIVVSIALFIAIGTAAVTNAVGLSPALGAFLAGLLLGETAYRHQLEVDIEPFKGILLGLFFMTVGTSLDVVALVEAPLAYMAALSALLVVKGVIVFVAARLFGLETPVAVETAFVLAGAGEFAFVAFKLAIEQNLLDQPLYQFVVTVAALAMLTIPALSAAGRRMAAAVTHKEAGNQHGLEAVDGGEALSEHVIIGGFGRVGRTVARVLDAEKIPFVALDIDADRVAASRQAGLPVYYGDASRREILERIGAARARAFLVTTNEPYSTERMVRSILAAWPDATIHARALDADHARKLAEIGVKDVVPEALEGSLLLAGRILVNVGMPDDAIDARLSVAREAEIQRLDDD